MTTAGLLLYVLGAAIGIWSASRLWRALRLLFSRQRPLKLRQFLIPTTHLVGATGVFALGAAARGAPPRGAPVIDAIALAVAVLLMLLALGALLAAFIRPPQGVRRRFLILVILALILLPAAHSVHIFPRVQREGVRAGIPTTALVIAWPWLPAGAQEELAGASSRPLTSWQRALLRWRCAGIIRTATDRAFVRAAARLFPEPAMSYPVASPRLLAGVFTEYCSTDAAVADRAAEFLFVALTSRFIPDRFDDTASRVLLPVVTSGLESPDAAVARRSAWTAAHLGRHAEPLLPTLERLVHASPADLEPLPRASLTALAAMSRDSEVAWRAFSALLSNPSAHIQTAALQETLHAGFKPRAAEIVAHALPLLESPSDAVAAAAATTLIFFCADPCAAAAAILARAQRSKEVAARSVHHLAQHCPSDALHGLIASMLAAPDARTRRFAVDACAPLGPAALRHRDALAHLARPDAPDRALAAAAAAILDQIDPPTAPPPR